MKVEELINANPRAVTLLPKALNDAIIGLTSDGRLIYSENKILVILQNSEGLSYEEALDHYANKTLSSLAHGNRFTPIIATETV